MTFPPARTDDPGDAPGTFLHSDRVLARWLARPVLRFLAVESAGAILLGVATVVALVWANSPWSEAYHDLFHTEVVLRVGTYELAEDLAHWINDGLMALFFFVVGLEIKREWVAGELRDRRAALLPALAAAGGMVAPAVVYLAFNAGGAGADGWGIPMATDIAFALGALAILGSRVPTSLKVFLLTLAIVDDIGAISVIAVFYADSIEVGWLAGAVGVVVVVVAARRARIVHPAVFVLLGLALWLCTYESGVHATIAGVAMGLLTPARPLQDEAASEAIVDTLEGREDLDVSDVRRVSFLVRSAVPLTERLEELLHPWTSYVIVPIFALANAGIELTGDSLTSGSAVTLGVAIGLVVGKVVGIVGASWLAVRIGWAALPAGSRWSQVVGIGLLAGIGFTVALFVAGLAFTDPAVVDEAKVGILAASVVAALLGLAVLSLTGSAGAADAGEGLEPVAGQSA